MKHFIILFYAYLLGLFRAVLMSNDKLIQYTFEVEKSKTLRTQSV